jgi:cellulose biosynthesis protein BcsQ
VTHDPYLLAISSHKGGTGRTTVALALAWLWGRAGLRVTLADADPVRAAGLVACPGIACSWPNVTYASGLPDPGDPALDADVVVIDCPALLDPMALGVLKRAQGVALTCLADPLSLRTVPAAAGVLASARVANPRLELLGLTLGLYMDGDELQAAMLDRVRNMHGDLLLEPPVPFDPGVRDWPLAPGAGLPAGPAAASFAGVADSLAGQARRLNGVALRRRGV